MSACARLALIPVLVLVFATTSKASPLFRDVNVLLYGDAGRGTSEQREVGRGMVKADARTTFDIALSLGDNQYIGKSSEVMKEIFETPYKTMIKRGLVFYQTLGNHDMERDRREGQLKYSRDQNVIARGVGGWALPADDYAIQNGNIRFIVTNTSAADGSVRLPNSRLKWIEQQLCGAREQWVFLVMHYPLWSSNSHGDNVELQLALHPVFSKCKPDALLAGHDHGGEAIQTPYGFRQFVLGNAAEANTATGTTAGISEWRYGDLGFGALSFSGYEATFSFYDKAAKPLHSITWTAARSRTE